MTKCKRAPPVSHNIGLSVNDETGNISHFCQDRLPTGSPCQMQIVTRSRGSFRIMGLRFSKRGSGSNLLAGNPPSIGKID